MTQYEPSRDDFYSNRPRSASLFPLIFGGVVAAAMVLVRSPFGAWLRGFLADWPNPAARSPDPLVQRGFIPETIPHQIIGRGKSAVAALYGPPRTAAGRTASPKPRSNFWSADTWYYPLDARSHTAIAVRFENGIARDVEFFQAPGITGLHSSPGTPGEAG